MTHKELEALVEKYEAKANKALSNYQETGAKKYQREYEANDDLAEALRIALNAKDEHDELRNYRCTVSIIAQQARADSKPDRAIKNLIAFAESQGLIPKDYGLIPKERS